MTKLDTTGRTNGAGDHFFIAGKEYVWVIGDDQLKAKPFNAEEFKRDIEALRRKLGAFLGDEVVGDA